MKLSAQVDVRIPALEQSKGPRDVAGSLRIHPIVLDSFCREESKSKYYKRHEVTKRSGESSPRVVYEVLDPLKRVQKIVFLWLRIQAAKLSHGSEPSILHGFQKGRSFISNASLHVGKDVVTVVDLRDFFGSISTERVVRGLQRMGCCEIVSVVLGDLVTLNGTLPQGGRCSPLLSNIVCPDLDARIRGIAESNNLVVSRYADDIAFSGGSAISREEISNSLRQIGFDIRPNSYRVMRRGGPQYVTGLCVADRQVVRVPRHTKRWLRLALHHAKADLLRHAEAMGRSPGEELNRLSGYVYYVASVEPELAASLYQQLNLIRDAYHAHVRDTYRAQAGQAGAAKSAGDVLDELARSPKLK